jgi:arylmalonate decarboxylase
MERKSSSDFPPEVFRPFDDYVHGTSGRREFLDRAARFAVGSCTAAAVLEALGPDFARAQPAQDRGAAAPPPSERQQGRRGALKDEAKVRFIAGSISPLGSDSRPMPMREPLLPPEVKKVTSQLDISDYTTDRVDEAIRTRYWECVDELVKEGANRITLTGLPISSQLGRPRVLKLLEETTKRTGIAADAHGEASIAAMRHLGMRRIAIASRWSEELNGKLTAYLTSAGFEVLIVTSAGQWAKEAGSMSIEGGVRLAFQLAREAMRKAPDADGLLLPGGAWRSLAAVPILEEDFGKPVVTNPNAEVWRLISQGVAPPVKGWGRLLATP